MSVYARVWDHDTRGVLHGLPALLEQFALRALIVARGGQTSEPRELVLLPPGIDATDEVHLLNELGFGPRPDDVKPADAAVLNGAIRGCPLYPFSGTSLNAHRFAAETGAHFRGPAFDLAWKWNDKGEFSRLAERQGWSGIMVPAGRVVGLEDLSPSHIADCRRMFGSRKLIIKGTRSASGLEQIVLHEHEKWDAIEARMNDLGRSAELVIQPWIEHDIDASVQFSVNAEGRRRILSDTTQLITDEVHHAGNVFPADLPRSWSYTRMCTLADHIICALVSEGLRDTVGSIDFIIDYAGNPWACEVNARVVAPWYPWKAMERRHRNVPPFIMRSVSLPKGTTASQIAQALGRQLLFDRELCIGVVPFCIVPDEGFAYTVTFGRNAAERSALFDEAMLRLSQLGA